MNTKVITYGLALIVVGLTVVFVRQDRTDELTASIYQTPNVSPGITPRTSEKSDKKAGMAGMVTPLLSPSVLVTVSPISMVSPSVSPKSLLVTPTLSPSNSPAISIVLSPSPTPNEVSPSPLVSPIPSPAASPTGSVVMNEVAWMGTEASQYGEWIELYNASSSTVSLTGWAIYGANDVKVIDLSGSIGPGAYFLIERFTDSSPDPVADVVADVSGKFGGSGLKNLPSGEDLYLRNAAHVDVDSVRCSGGWYAGDNATKATMERVNSIQNGFTASNWRTYANTSGSAHDAKGKPILGTPRARNSVSTE